MTHKAALAALVGAWVAGHTVAAPAATESLPLDPTHAVITFRAYMMGVFPVDGRFTRFQGVLTIDPAQLASCRVDLLVDVASLALSDAGIRSDVLSPELLDASQFPSFRYSGNCVDRDITGTLTLHGQSHPLAFAVHGRAPDIYDAQAMLDRRTWGITGRPLTAGRSIRIEVTTRVPRS